MSGALLGYTPKRWKLCCTLSPVFTGQKIKRKVRKQKMEQDERMKILGKLEELTLRVGALAAAAKLIEGELEQLQAVYYQRTEGCKV